MARPKTGAEAFAPAPTHTVGKPFRADGRYLDHGTPVDASDWRNTAKLVEQRYLIPIASAPSWLVAPAQAGEGTDSHGESTHQG